MRHVVLLAFVAVAGCKAPNDGAPSPGPSRSQQIAAVQGSQGVNRPREVPSGFSLGAVHLSREGVRIPIGSTAIRIAFAGAGRAGIAAAQLAAEPRVAGDRVEFTRSASLVEWWTQGPLGLEVGLDVATRLAGEGPLWFDFSLQGGATGAVVDGNRVRLVDSAGKTLASVHDLVVTDATGRELPSRFVDVAGRVRMEVRDEGAVYPLRIDPIVGVETKLVSPTPGLYSRFGSGVAVSGGRVLVGEAEADPGGKTNAGLAYVHAPTTLAIEGTLSPTDSASEDRFGSAVAMDGDTAIVGASTKNSYQGAAYVFVRGASGWTQQAKLVAADGAANDSFGASVSVSGDVAVVGAYAATVGGTPYAGAAYIFTRTGTSWSAGTKLTAASSGQYGWAVAASGTTVAIGSYSEAGSQGAVYVYTRSGTSWPLQQKVTIAASTTPNFGFAVALDGDTLAASAFKETVGSVGEAGAVYLFTRTSSTWSQQARLTAATPMASGQYGFSLGLSSNTLAVGHTGDNGVDAFLRTGTSWARKTSLVGTAFSNYGWSVDVDGDIAAFSAQSEDLPGKTGAGSVHVFTPILAYGNGTACGVGGACASGNCVDGVCCDTVCTESCRACNLAGKVGTCSAVDGAPIGARACTPSKYCKAGACSSDCTTEADCVAGHFCDLTSTPGTCKPKSGVGTCKDAKECSSGFCVDNHCCDSACGGQCEACDVAGKEGVCSPVSGAPHGSRATCDDGSDVCKVLLCDGAKDTTKCTVLKNVGVQCSVGKCSGSDLIGPSTCDDKGSCITPSASKCGRYSCDPAGPACRTKCSVPADCASGFTCLAGVCAEGARCNDDRSASIGKSGETTPCAPFFCAGDGNCGSTCITSAECATSAACDIAAARCVPVVSTAEDSGGCAYGAPSKAITPAVLALLLAGLVRRRRAA